MPKKWFPPRPAYKKEKLLAGFLALAAFLLLFVCRCAQKYGGPLFTKAPMFLAMETLEFLLPALVFCGIKGGGYFRFLRLKPPRGIHTLYLAGAFFSLLFGSLLLSVLTKGIYSLGSSVHAFEASKQGGFLEGTLHFLALALVPAILEEFFFRGLLMAEYERRGAFRAVFLSALLFSLIHFDPPNLAVYLFSGVLLALVLLATDSLIATTLLHILYNTVCLFGGRYLNALYDFTGSVELFLFFLILGFLLSLLLFCRQGQKLYRIYARGSLEAPQRAVPYEVQFYTTLDAITNPPVLLCIAVAIVGMIFFR